MKLEDILKEEFKRLDEEFGSAMNFTNRLKSRGSEIGPEGIREINRLRLDLFKRFEEFTKTVERLAKKDLESKESKDMVAKKVLNRPEEVSKLIFERIFKEIEKQ